MLKTFSNRYQYMILTVRFMRDLLSGFAGATGLVVVDVAPEESVFVAFELIDFNGDFLGLIPFVKLSDDRKRREARKERARSRECVFER